MKYEMITNKIKDFYESINLTTNPWFIYKTMSKILGEIKDSDLSKKLDNYLRPDMNANAVRIIIEELQGIEKLV